MRLALPIGVILPGVLIFALGIVICVIIITLVFMSMRFDISTHVFTNAQQHLLHRYIPLQLRSEFDFQLKNSGCLSIPLGITPQQTTEARAPTFN